MPYRSGYTDYPRAPAGIYAALPQVVEPYDYPTRGFSSYAALGASHPEVLTVLVVDAASGRPLPYARVAMEDGSVRVATGHGLASFSVAPGPHYVGAAAFGWEEYEHDVTVGGMPVDVTLGLSQTGTSVAPSYQGATVDARVSGKVVDAVTGQPVPGATVTVDRDGLDYPTDAAGGFTVAVRPGTHVVMGRAPGYRSGSYAVTVAAGEDKRGQIPLAAGVEAPDGVQDAGGGHRGLMAPLLALGAAGVLWAALRR